MMKSYGLIALRLELGIAGLYCNCQSLIPKAKLNC